MASRVMRGIKLLHCSRKEMTRRMFSNAPVSTRTEKLGPITWSGLALAGMISSGVIYYYYMEKDRLQTQSTSKVTSYTLLYFGFTHCPDICPNELRDTIAQMQIYKADFHPKFKMLTGTRDQIAEITKAYRVYFSKADENDDDEDDYLVDHSIVMYLVGPDGEFLDFFTQAARVDDIVAKIKTYFI
ncbi:unnamed protein product [Peronospora belbahrii]|uniref:Thioredoxin domain-containing protein n=1 Tax=Peronospora belbahrii TaxID=622444 RepID=A0ABN8CV82_9STRA|nr:unnamed protein product [Peronospora belbahrii]